MPPPPRENKTFFVTKGGDNYALSCINNVTIRKSVYLLKVYKCKNKIHKSFLFPSSLHLGLFLMERNKTNGNKRKNNNMSYQLECKVTCRQTVLYKKFFCETIFHIYTGIYRTNNEAYKVAIVFVQDVYFTTIEILIYLFFNKNTDL